MYLIKRIIFKLGRRIFCYIEEDPKAPAPHRWVLFSGRPCDPNKLRWGFPSEKKATRFAVSLLPDSARLKSVYQVKYIWGEIGRAHV